MRHSVSPAARLEAVARARHDLGKYVAFQSRCLEADPTDAQLRLALDADLRLTRTSPPAGCADIWRELRAEFDAADVDADEIAAVDAAVAALAAGAANLDALAGPELRQLQQTAIGLGDRLRALHRRLQAATPEGA